MLPVRDLVSKTIAERTLQRRLTYGPPVTTSSSPSRQPGDVTLGSYDAAARAGRVAVRPAVRGTGGAVDLSQPGCDLARSSSRRCDGCSPARRGCWLPGRLPAPSGGEASRCGWWRRAVGRCRREPRCGPRAWPAAPVPSERPTANRQPDRVRRVGLAPTRPRDPPRRAGRCSQAAYPHVMRGHAGRRWRSAVLADPRDWSQPGTVAIAQPVLCLRAGAVVLQHTGDGNVTAPTSCTGRAGWAPAARRHSVDALQPPWARPSRRARAGAVA